jgi:hypothetical protein
MLPYQERVVEEKGELDVKIGKLFEFVESERFDEVEAQERLRLVRQLSVMREYSGILGVRIESFGVSG